MVETIGSNDPIQDQIGNTRSDTSPTAFQESDAILHSFFDSAPMMMGVVDIMENDIMHLSDNPTTARFMGVAPGTTQYKLASEIGMPPEAIAEWLQHYRRCALTHSTVRFNYAHHTPHEVRWLSVTVSSIATTAEGRARCSYIAEDITEQKRFADLLRQRSEALSESEQRLRTLIDHFPNGAVVLFDQDLRFIVAGGAALSEAGMQPHFLEGKTVWEAFDPEVAAINDPLMRMALTGHPSTKEVAFGGSTYELHVVPIRNSEGEVVAGMTLTQDITAREATERQQRFLAEATNLLTSSLDYQTTLQSVAKLVVPHLADWCVVYLINEAGALELVTVEHVDPAKVGMAHEASRRYPPNLNAKRGIANVLRSGKSEWIEEIGDEVLRSVARDEEHYRMLSTSGMQSYLCVPLLARGKTLGAIVFIGAETGHRYTAESLTLAEELARHVAIAVENARLYAAAQREIEERQRAEIALEESRDYYRTLTEAVPQLVWTAGPDGMADYFNPRWYAYTGQDPADVSIKRSGSLHPDDRPYALDRWQEVVLTGEAYQVEYRLRRFDGVYRWFLVRAVPLKNAEGKILKWFGTCTDIDEQKQAEMQIAELNARLRRSVQETHHRVKNNLQIISALAELQIEEGDEAVPVAAVKRIGQHTRSLAAIHDLLTQETKADARTDSISIKAALDKLVPLLQATTGGRHIRYQVTDFRLPVREGASLALLVSELVSNAVKHGHDSIELTIGVEGETARLEVCDNGPGFPDGFDWHKSASTGIGLIDSTGRHDLQGTITYENRPEGGACVTVSFPIPQPPTEPSLQSGS